jgi:PadR family transcriptional regulator, regulatory protein PadR
MVEELARQGYRISAPEPSTLLYGLEKKGYLRSTEQRNGKSLRKVYRATPLGHRALAAASAKVREFIGELMEGQQRAC